MTDGLIITSRLRCFITSRGSNRLLDCLKSSWRWFTHVRYSTVLQASRSNLILGCSPVMSAVGRSVVASQKSQKRVSHIFAVWWRVWSSDKQRRIGKHWITGMMECVCVLSDGENKKKEIGLVINQRWLVTLATHMHLAWPSFLFASTR